MKIEGVVFDLDHTLFDRYETIKLCTPLLFDEFKEYFSKDYNQEKFTQLFIQTDKEKIHYGWDSVFDRYEEKGLIKSHKTFPREEFLAEIFNAYKKFSVKYDFTAPLLDKLKKMNLKIGLITNGKSELQRTKLKNLEINDYFDALCISGEVGIEKPDIKIFEIMSQRIGIAPEKLLYVGDHPVNDATASSKAGYIPVLVMTMGFETMPEAKNFDLRVNNISELIDLIKDKFC